MFCGTRTRSFSSCLLVLVLVVSLCDAGLYSQQSPTATYSVKVKVVNMLATVRDKHGQIIRSLTKDDFTLEEDGRPQTIRYFTRETDMPLTLGLLVDTSRSQLRLLDQERTASHSFLDQMLRENKDNAFLIHFDSQVELLQDATGSRQKLEQALADVNMSPEEQPVSGSPGSWPGRGGHRHGGGGGGGGRGAAGTLLYDAVFLASDELMKKEQGRKALIILSDGVDQGSKLSVETAIAAAQRADTMVYSILFADPQFYNQGPFGGWGGHRGGWGGRFPQEDHPDGKKIMEKLANETGGRFFEVGKKQSIEQIYTQIQEELRNQYSIGYTPDRSNPGPGYHKLHLATKQKDMIVQTREGYYWDR